MILRIIAIEEKLCAVERILEGDDVFDHVNALKEIAKDLRARAATAPSVAILEIERRLIAVARSKTRQGYETGAMIGVAQELIARWPVIRQALEKFGRESDD